MNTVFKYLGGRKVAIGILFAFMLMISAFKMETENLRIFETGLFAFYASMVLGNVGSKYVLKNKNNDDA